MIRKLDFLLLEILPSTAILGLIKIFWPELYSWWILIAPTIIVVIAFFSALILYIIISCIYAIMQRCKKLALFKRS